MFATTAVQFVQRVCVCDNCIVCVCERALVSDYICVSVRDDCIKCVRKLLCVSEFKMIVFLCMCVHGDRTVLVCKIVFLCVCVGSSYFPPLALNPFLSRRLILPLITI